MEIVSYQQEGDYPRLMNPLAERLAPARGGAGRPEPRRRDLPVRVFVLLTRSWDIRSGNRVGDINGRERSG